MKNGLKYETKHIAMNVKDIDKAALKYDAVNFKDIDKTGIKYNPSELFNLKKYEAINFRDLMRGVIKNDITRRIIGHETNTIVGYFTSVDQLRKNRTPKETIAMMEGMAIEGSKAIEELKPLLNKKFTKKELKEGNSNFYNIFNKIKDYYGIHVRKKNIKINISGEDTDCNISKPYSVALAHTLYGDSVKFAKENSNINTSIKENKGNIEILIENTINDKVTENIGEGTGTGTDYINKFLDKVQGTKINYNESKLSETKEPIWGTKILIPTDKNTLAELVQ